MDDKKIMIIAGVIVVIVAVVALFTIFGNDKYKEVDEGYVKNPIEGEDVKFTATYFGKTSSDAESNMGADVDVVRLDYSNTFAFIKGHNGDFAGKEGQDFKLEGKFLGGEKQKAAVDGLLAEGYVFEPDSITQI